MTTDSEVIYQCLEALAKTDTDLAPAVYDNFTANMPEAGQHLSIMDSRMKGRMLDQVFQLLLGEVDDNYLEFETHMHRGYGANTELYRGLFIAVKDAAKHALAATWSGTEETAWDSSIDRLVDEIQQLGTS